MKEIKYFYLSSCPYCHQADRIISELINENPNFADIKINKIEESQNSKLANNYDYYYVPCLWIEKTKLMEGVPTKEKIRGVLDTALEK